MADADEVNDDRVEEMKAFDETKAGVKGLVDAGLVRLPKIFIRSAEDLAKELNSSKGHLQVPVIDLGGITGSHRRKMIVDEVESASEKWGFFQIVNHGIPIEVLDGMIDGIRKFHEEDVEIKKGFYSRDRMRKVRFESNFDLYRSRTANWRDTLTVNLAPSGLVDPNELPAACRETTMEYIKQITQLGGTLLELLSEALGLKPDHLGGGSLECARGRTFVCHYYPACPEPELTLGASKHTDPAFLTLLLQDQIGGLQVLHDNYWVDVPPIPGSLVVNIGDFLQIISNGKFESVYHRVVAKLIGPRISVAGFFNGVSVPPKPYGPIRELISEESPAVYKEFMVTDYMKQFFSRPLYDKSGTDLYRI